MKNCFMIHLSVFYSKQILKKSFIFLFKGVALIHVEVKNMLLLKYKKIWRSKTEIEREYTEKGRDETEKARMSENIC